MRRAAAAASTRSQSERSEKFLRGLKGNDNSVHLGAGDDLRPGWINLGIWPEPPSPAPGVTTLVFDLRRGLPVPAGSCARIYSSHFFEHLPWNSGEDLMELCLVALRPGGEFRMALPDFELVLRRYLAGDQAFFDENVPRERFPIHSRPGAESLIDFVNYAVYQDGEHLTMFDTEKAVRLLTVIGFRNARITEFDPAWDLDLPLRRASTFYVHAER
jgi:predicted SAM-dependent methyltransferase